MQRGWTLGAEHEFMDWPIDRPLPKGCTLNHRENTQVNSTGIATDPAKRRHLVTYPWGGEINTAPTTDIDGQLSIVDDFLAHNQEACSQYRSALQIHIRVPGLRDDLAALKQLAQFNLKNLRRAMELVDPLPPVTPQWYSMGTPEEIASAKRFALRRKRDRQTMLTERVVERQMLAQTPQAFFEAEPPRDANGRLMWHAQPRAAVNVRQLLETDTIEFRHFPGTTSRLAIRDAFRWCINYLEAALFAPEVSADQVFASSRSWAFPQDVKFEHWMEQRFWATCHCENLSRQTILENIAKIEDGTFDAYFDKPRRLPL